MEETSAKNAFGPRLFELPEQIQEALTELAQRLDPLVGRRSHIFAQDVSTLIMATQSPDAEFLVDNFYQALYRLGAQPLGGWTRAEEHEVALEAQRLHRLITEWYEQNWRL